MFIISIVCFIIIIIIDNIRIMCVIIIDRIIAINYISISVTLLIIL